MNKLNKADLIARHDNYESITIGLWWYVWILLFFTITFRVHISGDTVALLNGLDNALQCLVANPIQWPCGAKVVHYPIFQYLIALPFRLIGLEKDIILHFLIALNVGWFIVSIMIFWCIGFVTAGVRGGHLALVILFSGYIIWYPTTSFNESASFALFALLAFSVLEKYKIIWVTIIAFLCTITKEIAFPFVFGIIMGAALARDRESIKLSNILLWVRTSITSYLCVIMAIAFGVAVNLLFNLFRFGSVKNIPLLDPQLHTPWPYVYEFFFDLWFSPASGLFFLWGTLCLLTSFGFYIYRHDVKRLCILILLVGIISLVNFGLARWFSPFGAYAWGPRLTLPYLGGIGVILIAIVGADLIKMLSRIRNTTIYGIIGAGVFVLAMPNIAVCVDGGRFFREMYAPTILQRDFGINKFTIQTVPINLYVHASLELQSRNILIPVTAKVASENLLIFIGWFMLLISSIRTICRDRFENNFDQKR